MEAPYSRLSRKRGVTFDIIQDDSMRKGGYWDDHYARRAREENWRARSVYKLEEIDRRVKILHPGFRVLDLGAYPGSWSLYSLKKVGQRGDVVGIDLKEPDQINASNFTFILADILTLDPQALGRDIGQRDVVLSDLAPQTTGIHVTDTSRSMMLARKAMEIALAVLKTRGHFLCKIFEGEDLINFKRDAAGSFKQLRLIRPSAVRKKSREVYLVGLDRLGG